MFSSVVVKKYFKLWCVLSAVQCVTAARLGKGSLKMVQMDRIM